MPVMIPDLLSDSQLEAVCSVLRQGRFVDGRLSAGDDARDAKNNLELEADAKRHEALNNVVMSALLQHPLYLRHSLPARIAAPIYARYLDGMAYGGHIDDPLMGSPAARYRSDISISIFLNPPGEYSGGELCIESAAGLQSFKPDAGSALLYPSTCYHSVSPVSAGERLVAVTWVQSHVRHAEQRQILAQLDEARELLAANPASAEYRKVNLSYANLFRMWAEV